MIGVPVTAPQAYELGRVDRLVGRVLQEFENFSVQAVPCELQGIRPGDPVGDFL